jgi:DNA polymerase zeta
MQPPLGDLDARISPLSALAVPQVPVIHLFGPSLSGQKCCVHVHGVLPFFFVPLPKDIKVDLPTVKSMAAKFGAPAISIMSRN